MGREQTRTDDTGMDESAIADYLRDNPDFFTRHQRLAADLTIPHDVEPAVSLVAYQVRLLREEKQRLRWRLDELLRVARDNDRVAEQLHRLGLELLEARDLDAAIVTLREGLQADFRADVITLRLIGDGVPDANVDVLAEDDPEVQRLPELFRGERPVVGRLTAEQMRLAFGDQGGELGSAAVIPFTDGEMRGVIGIGSYDAERFSGEQGTVFLARLGDLIGRVLRCSARRDHG